MTKNAAKFCIIVWTAIILAVPHFGPLPANAEIPAAGNCYSGRMPLKSGDIEISLCLYDKSFFILGQSQMAKGRQRSRDLCGKWRLVGGNSILRLSNSHGFEQKLNIGTGGLYGDFFAGQSALPKSLILKKKSFEKIPFSGSGLLRQKGDSLSLVEAASGRTFASRISAIENFAELAGKMKESLGDGKPLFADARLAPETGGGKILALRHVSDKLPGMVKDKSTARAGSFREDVENEVWSVDIPGTGQASCRFTPLAGKRSSGSKGKKKRPEKNGGDEQEKGGLLEISAPGFRLEARYHIKKSRFDIKMDKNEISRLAALGAEEFAQDLLAVESWQLEDNVLVLKGANIPDIVLTKLGKTS